jgi:hypothetical protein
MVEEKKCAVIIPSSEVVGQGDQRRVVPNIVKVYEEKDMSDKLIFKGPEKKGGVNTYVTVDGKKLRFDGKTGALLSLLLLVATFNLLPSALAQAPGRTKVEIPAIEAPYVTQKSVGALAPASLLIVNVSAGKVYLGSGAITVAETTVTALTANKTDCDGPTYTACNLIYADSSGTVAKTLAIATARGAGNSILAYVETDGTKVTNIQSPWQDTRSDIDTAATADALTSNPTDCAANTYATTIAANGNLTCASVTNASTTAVSTNTASTIALRDASGDFAAGIITAALVGNSSTASALAANPGDCGANTYATTIAASGALTCATVTLASADFANQGTATTVLHGNGAGNPAFAAVSLTADVSGVTPLGNGGTGILQTATQQTAATNGTQVAAGTCQAQTPLAIANVVATSKAFWTLPNAPAGTWQTGIAVQLVVSAGAVTPYLCNPTAGAITPAAQVLNIGVIL